MEKASLGKERTPPKKQKESKGMLKNVKSKSVAKMSDTKTVKKEGRSKCDERKPARLKNADKTLVETSDEGTKVKIEAVEPTPSKRKRKSSSLLLKTIKVEMDSPSSNKKPKTSQSKITSTARPQPPNEKLRGSKKRSLDAVCPEEGRGASGTSREPRKRKTIASKRGSSDEKSVPSKRALHVPVPEKGLCHSKKAAVPRLLAATDIKKEPPPKSHPQRMASLDAMARMHVLCTPDRKTTPKDPAPPDLLEKIPHVVKKESGKTLSTTVQTKTAAEVKQEPLSDFLVVERSVAVPKKARVDPPPSNLKAKPTKQKVNKTPHQKAEKASGTKNPKQDKAVKSPKPGKLVKSSKQDKLAKSSKQDKLAKTPKSDKLTKSFKQDKLAKSSKPDKREKIPKSDKRTKSKEISSQSQKGDCCKYRLIPLAHVQSCSSAAANFSLHRCLYSRPDCGCCCSNSLVRREPCLPCARLPAPSFAARPLCSDCGRFEAPFPELGCCACRCLSPPPPVDPRCCRRDLVLVPRCFGCSPRRYLDKLFPCKKRSFAHGWNWAGSPVEKFISLTNDSIPRSRQCYPAVRHREGELVRERDCVLLKSGPRDADLPYVAKVAAFWEDPDDGEMMMSLLWYYRPEHTEQGRRPGQMEDEVFASKHRDTNSVACIEDKCYVLTFAEYCRYRAELSRGGGGGGVAPGPPGGYPRRARLPPLRAAAEMVLFCRSVYDFRQKRLLKNPS